MAGFTTFQCFLKRLKGAALESATNRLLFQKDFDFPVRMLFGVTKNTREITSQHLTVTYRGPTFPRLAFFSASFALICFHCSAVNPSGTYPYMVTMDCCCCAIIVVVGATATKALTAEHRIAKVARRRVFDIMFEYDLSYTGCWTF